VKQRILTEEHWEVSEREKMPPIYRGLEREGRGNEGTGGKDLQLPCGGNEMLITGSNADHCARKEIKAFPFARGLKRTFSRKKKGGNPATCSFLPKVRIGRRRTEHKSSVQSLGKTGEKRGERDAGMPTGDDLRRAMKDTDHP